MQWIGGIKMKCELSKICSYVKEKVFVDTLTKSNYISTENMKPDKGGILDAASLPSVIQTQGYRIGDVLVSNIRPYFKKIWLAKENGGCSNDILVMRANKEIYPEFLYYVLSDDAFFEYSMATSNGTKMPRGDKSAIMKYHVPVFDFETQKKIAGVLGDIDGKIQNNIRINDNLAYVMGLLKLQWYRSAKTCSRKYKYRKCIITRMLNSSRPKSREQSMAA